ncbi:MAG: site-specific DNA-methyltransferase [Myxococcales bacterium]|nr:site-specific DNA-methyltransferase [Myxococcales bacterium]
MSAPREQERGDTDPAISDDARRLGDRVELVWPGKYDDRGRRVELPRTGARLQLDARLRGAAVRRPGLAPAEPSPAGTRGANTLVCGDNLQVMEAWLERYEGAVDLVYIDPPFMTGNRFPVITRVGEGEGDERPAELRTLAYDDAWRGGLAGFLRMLDPRLRLLRRLLAPRGSLYIHVDPTVGHAVKLLADEIFGPGCFQREIVWRIGWLSGFKTRARNWIRNHDLIFFYTRTPGEFIFNKRYVPYPEGYRRRDGSPPRGKGVPLEDVWNANASEFDLRGRASLDSIQIKSFSTEKTGWATQKNESLLRRIITASSNPGSLVADVFCGSGTTLKVAHELGRGFLGCDRAEAAVHIASKRLLDGDAPADLERASLGASEWRGVSTRALVEAAGGRAGEGAPAGARALHGRVGEGERDAIWVAALDRPLGQVEIREVIALAAARGVSRLRVVARAWGFAPRR